MKARKRITWINMVLASVLALLLAAGCANSGGTGAEQETNANESANEAAETPSAEAPATNEQPEQQPEQLEQIEISIMSPLHLANPPTDVVKTVLEEKTNTILNVEWVPSNVYAEATNAMLASGDMPQVYMSDHAGSIPVPILNAIKLDTFWEIEPYLAEFPHLQTINPTVLDNLRVDGKVYGIPRLRPISTAGITFRKDWLDKLGLELRTTDDLYEALRAFTQDDPDGNGQDDTFGMTTYGTLAFDRVKMYFGSPNEWGVEDGKLIPEFYTEEYKQALDFMRRVYSEGLVNTDFPVANETQMMDHFHQGKAGMILNSVIGWLGRDPLLKLDSTAVVDITNRIQGPKGDRIAAGPGHTGMAMFPKSSVETEDELRRLLAFFDQFWEQDIDRLVYLGIEGVHWKFEGDKMVRVPENFPDKFNLDVQPWFAGIGTYRQALYELDQGDELRNKQFELYVDNDSIAVGNPAQALISATYTEIGGELDKIIDDAVIKYILGSIDANGFEAEVETWRSRGGSKVVEEVNQLYAALQ